MPTLALFTNPPTINGSRRVTAPGGYERWRMIADDPAEDRQLIIEYITGDPLDADYLRNYDAYLKNPTRVSPPLPSDAIGIRMSFIARGKVLSRAENKFLSDGCIFSDDRLDLKFAGNYLRDIDGAIEFSIGLEHFAVELRVQRSVDSVLKSEPIYSVQVAGEHRTIATPAAMRCVGEVRLPKAIIAFDGNCDFVHSFGTRPRERAFRSWFDESIFFGSEILRVFAGSPEKISVDEWLRSRQGISRKSSRTVQIEKNVSMTIFSAECRDESSRGIVMSWSE